MKKLENKIDSSKKINPYKKGAGNVAIGVGMAVLGVIFNYDFVHEILLVGGAGTVGYNLKDSIKYVKYFRYKKSTPYLENTNSADSEKKIN